MRRWPGPSATAQMRVKQLGILRAWLDAAPAEFVRPLRVVTGAFNSLADSPSTSPRQRALWKRITDHRPVTLTIPTDAPVGAGPMTPTQISTQALPVGEAGSAVER